LALFEANRLQATAHPAPMRVVRVVTGVFKARRRRDGADLYLMQFDHRAGRYQPIGGKCEAGDVSNEAALLREICEELVVADLRPGVDLVIEPLLEHVQTAEVSASLGVITQYDHNFFLVKTVRFPIRIDADTRWLSERELLAGRADDGRAVTPLLHSHMAALLPALPYSLADAVD
jgi:8-oxo-dGTP pyrophosphatase MutT (NUDIX family)